MQKPRYILDVISTFPDGAGIVYVGTRAKADDILDMLLTEGIEAVGYHAGMNQEERKWVQENFMSGKAQVIVATNAFGMGIDKKDIRFVIHFDLPGTVEAYYQEAGRAGRDGKPSVCLLMYHPRDRYLREFFIRGDNPTPELIRQVYQYLLDLDNDKILVTYADIKAAVDDEAPEMAIGTSLKILEQAGYLRRNREKSGQAFLKLKASVEEIGTSFTKRSAKQIEVFAKLTDRFGTELINGWETNLEDTAGIINVTKDSLVRLVKKLATANQLEYRPPFKGTEIEILKRVDSWILEIDTKALKEKAIHAYTKLDMMEQYVFTPICRQSYLLKYFGDDELERCEKCDRCLRGDRVEEIEMRVSKKPEAKLSTKLTQLETFELLNKKMGIDEIAAARDLDRKIVIEHIKFLIDKKLITKPEKLLSKKDILEFKK